DGQEDGDTTAVTSSTVGQVDQYGGFNTVGTPAAIVMAIGKMWARKTDVGARSGRMRWNSGGTVADSTAGPLSMTRGFLSDCRTVDPNTNLPWSAPALGPSGIDFGPMVAA